MKCIKCALLGVLFVLPLILQAQHPINKTPLEYKLSEVFKLRGSEAGYFTEFLGYDDKSIYVLLVDKKTYAYELCKKAWIQKVDKETLNEVAKVEILDKGSKAKLKEAYLIKGGLVVVKEEAQKSGEVKIFADKWNADLVKTSSMVPLVTFNKKTSRISIKSDTDKPFITVLTQGFEEKGGIIDFDFYQFDENLKKQREGQIELGLVAGVGKFNDKRSNASNILKDIYQTQSGDLVAITEIAIDPDDTSLGSKLYLKFIRTSNNTVLEEEISLADEAYIREYKFYVEGDRLSVIGFYSDPRWVERLELKDLKLQTEYKTFSGAISGTFLFEYDLRDYSLVNNFQKPLSEEFIAEVEGNNPLIKKFDPKKRKYSTYKINRIEYNAEEKSAIFNCEYAINYLEITTYSNGNTSKQYVSKRGNAFFFKLNTVTGDMEWVSSVVKDATLTRGNSSAWYSTMMTVISDKNQQTYKVIINEYEVTNEDGSTTKLKANKYDASFFIAEIDKSNGRITFELPNKIDKKSKPYFRLENTMYLTDIESGYYFTRNQHLTKRVGRSIILNALIPTYIFGFGIIPGYIYAKSTRLKKYNTTYTVGKIAI